jgi:peptidoglycan/LPS O-acetylase OafA/YrhL
MYKNELPFLNIIRGSSALLVIIFHFFIFFFTAQEMSAGLINAEPLNLPDPFYLSFMESLPINIGHLGVSFFFLMSGFFILPSLEKYNLMRPFLIHKILRLWPSYVVCFGLGLIFVYFFALLRNDIYPYSVDHVLSYFFWSRDIFGYDYIDGSVWSLEVQVKYYIYAAIVWVCCRRYFLEAMSLSLIALCLLGFVAESQGWFEESSYNYLVYVFNKEIKYSLLITMGLCLYAHYKKQHSVFKPLFFGVLLLACFLSPFSYPRSEVLTYSYCLGLFLFTCSLLFTNVNKKRTGYMSKAMEWVAKISYPLYIGHVLPGYTIMYYLLEQGVNLYLTLSLALGVSFLIAYVVHEKVEKVFSAIKVERADSFPR